MKTRFENLFRRIETILAQKTLNKPYYHIDGIIQFSNFGEMPHLADEWDLMLVG